MASYKIFYQFGAGGRTISVAFGCSVLPDEFVDFLYEKVAERFSTLGFKDPSLSIGELVLYKTPSKPPAIQHEPLGFDPQACQPLDNACRISQYWPSAPELTVHVLAYFHSYTRKQDVLIAAPNITLDKKKEKLVFKLELKRDGEKVQPMWNTFFTSNADECQQVIDGDLPPEIEKIVEMPRKPHGLPEQTVMKIFKTYSSSDTCSALEHVISDDQDAQDYFENNDEITHYLSALSTTRNQPSDQHLTSELAGHVLIYIFVAHWEAWIPSGSYRINTALPLSFLLHAHKEGNVVYRCDFHPGWACLDHALHRLLVEFESSSDDERRLQVQLLCTFKFALLHVPDHKKNTFFLMGLYITKLWYGHCWVVYREEGEKISLHRRDYNLKVPIQLVCLIRALYNYSYYIKNDGPVVEAPYVNKLAREVKESYPNVLSTKTSKKPQLGENDDESGQGGEHLQVCKAIESALLDSGYAVGKKIKEGVFRALYEGKPFIAKLVHQDELSFLRHLSSIESLQKHTIDCFDTLDSSLGKLVMFPMYHSLDKIGVEINTSSPLSGWTIQLRRQLVDGIAFLHKQHIAHLDIKPSNLVYDFEVERLFIIDFDAAVWCNDMEKKVEICWGTEGWTAPEVVLDESEPAGAVSPIRVDLWSCGRVLAWFDQFSRPCAKDTRLTRLSSLLMDKQPEYRPLLHEIIDEDQGFWHSERLIRALDKHCDYIQCLGSVSSKKRARRTDEDQNLDPKRRRKDEETNDLI